MTDTAGGLERAAEILEQAAGLSGAGRAAYLREACGDDDALRAEVDSMLAAQAEQGAFLADPTQAAGAGVEELTIPSSPHETIGQQIGRYKLLQIIGEGGFGAVYMAEQREPVKRKVALKIIKLGMDTKQVIARFEAERQALAMMDHPNIARVFDAGATDTGRPYFVMELVRGIPIDEYCDKNNLSTRDRLELFVLVCQAVQHAHQKGIIHRDLKPSNILITLHDGRPVPKVIDFGIAKAVSRELTDKTLFTEFRQFIGTPEYMSPEQAEMSGLDVDTRSDIYSLGVLLYELLTGTTPFDAAKLRAAGYGEIQRIIREEEPHRPSTRVSTMGDEVSDIAKHRNTDAMSLNRILRRDLDWIVMKAMAKDRTRRYETANGLAMEVRRYLDDEPVIARPPSPAYRLAKFVRRNRTAVTAGSLVVVALVVGLAAAITGFIQADRQGELYRQEAVKAASLNTFLQDMLASVNPTVSGGRVVTVRTMLDHAVGRLDAGELNGQPEAEASLRYTIGKTYASLGLHHIARPHLDRALQLHLEIFGERDLRTADAMYAVAQHIGHRAPEGGRLYQRVLDVRRERLGEGHPKTLQAMYYAAWGRYHGQSFEAGEELHRETLALRRKWLGEDHPDTAKSWNCVGVVCARTDRPEEAESFYARALEISRTANGPYHPDTLTYVSNLAGMYQWRGADAEALALLSAAVPESRMGAHNPRSLGILRQLVDINMRREDPDEARAWGLKYKEALEERVELSGNDPAVLLEYAQLLLTIEPGELRDPTEGRRAAIRALDLAASDPAILNGAAWLLLTIEPAELRDPARALQAAAQANTLTGDADAEILDTLALAQHLTGNTRAAIETQRRVVDLMPDDAELAARLAEYEAALAGKASGAGTRAGK